MHSNRRPSMTTTILAGLRAGDQRAFETLVRIYGGRLLAVARRFVRNDEDAQDIVQSAYLNAFRAVSQFEGNCLLATWLHRIVVNTALMKLRSRRRKPEESIEDLLPAFQEDGHHVEQFSDWNTPADVLIHRARDTRDGPHLHRAVARQLPRGADAARHRGTVDRGSGAACWPSRQPRSRCASTARGRRSRRCCDGNSARSHRNSVAPAASKPAAMTPDPFLVASVPPVLRWTIERALGLATLRRLYRSVTAGAIGDDATEPFERRALRALGVELNVSRSDLHRIPSDGPVLVTANHPHGALDGLLLAELVRRVRPDVRLVANFFLPSDSGASRPLLLRRSVRGIARVDAKPRGPACCVCLASPGWRTRRLSCRRGRAYVGVRRVGRLHLEDDIRTRCRRDRRPNRVRPHRRAQQHAVLCGRTECTRRCARCSWGASFSTSAGASFLFESDEATGIEGEIARLAPDACLVETERVPGLLRRQPRHPVDTA